MRDSYRCEVEAYRDNVALVSGRMRVYGSQQYSESLLVTVAAVKWVAAILRPAGLTIHTTQHCNSIYLISQRSKVKPSRLQIAIRKGCGQSFEALNQSCLCKYSRDEPHVY